MVLSFAGSADFVPIRPIKGSGPLMEQETGGDERNP